MEIPTIKGIPVKHMMIGLILGGEIKTTVLKV